MEMNVGKKNLCNNNFKKKFLPLFAIDQRQQENWNISTIWVA